jgi:transposase InsO family protein
MVLPMGRKVIEMEQKLAAVFADVAAGRATVTAVCAGLGIGRDSYYRYKRRFAAEGLAGLTPRSRTPPTSPRRTGQAMAGLIAAARKRLEAEGWDGGALSVQSRLPADGVADVPCARTIHRVLRRAGMVEPEPGKRPRSSYRRFVFPASDDLWQIDAYEYALADSDATTVAVFEILDDHSRYNVEAMAWPTEDAEGAWTAFSRAVARYGQPRTVLSDNGLAFTGRRPGKGQRVLFEKNLAALGVKPIDTSPRHPQTNGKNERAHATARRRLAAQPPATSLGELQAQLDDYRPAYNRRPHQGLDRDTPPTRRAAGMRPAPPTAEPIPLPDVYDVSAAARDGYVCVQATIIPLGTEYAGLPMTVFVTGDHAPVFHREQLVRELDIDRTRTRQAPMRPRDTHRKRGTLTSTPPN